MKSTSCWTDNAPATRYQTLARSGETDVVVVGAGIVGLTVAYLLARARVAVTVLEARRIARGATALSTAKVTSQHGLAFGEIARRHGEDKARLYAEANTAGASWIAGAVRELRIDCDLEERVAYAYALHEDRREALAREAELAGKFGLAAEFLARAPLPFEHAGAVAFARQAQFNPAKYLVGLAAAVREAGGRIHENSRVTAAEDDGGWSVRVGRHRVKARHVVMACHMPIGSPVPYDEITQPRAHAAMAFRAPVDALVGMFIGVDDPGHSLRMGRDGEGPLVVALSPRFPTGHDGNVAMRFAMLEQWMRRNLPAVGEARYAWFNEDYDSPDGIPLAGELARKAPGLCVATGFGGWGISNGTAAGLMIADQVRGRKHPWASLYAPERRAKKANEGGDTHTPLLHAGDLKPNEGGVVTVGKRKIAVYRSGSGQLRALSASCTHKGCTVTWSNADRTWQCPCHGSVFAADGSVLHGPATAPLKPARVPSG